MARYSNEFKARAVARLLPPESAPILRLSQEIGVSVATLERWMSDALSRPAFQRGGFKQRGGRRIFYDVTSLLGNSATFNLGCCVRHALKDSSLECESSGIREALYHLTNQVQVTPLPGAERRRGLTDSSKPFRNVQKRSLSSRHHPCSQSSTPVPESSQVSACFRYSSSNGFATQ